MFTYACVCVLCCVYLCERACACVCGYVCFFVCVCVCVSDAVGKFLDEVSPSWGPIIVDQLRSSMFAPEPVFGPVSVLSDPREYGGQESLVQKILGMWATQRLIEQVRGRPGCVCVECVAVCVCVC